MFKIIKADKDTYITNRIIKGVSSETSNVGLAGSLDLFKLYGATLSGSTPNTELSRLLVHFDITPIFALSSSHTINVQDDSFFARLIMRDVYGGQPTPSRYTLSICPMSMSFDEGLGKDVVYYSDIDSANFISASHDESWNGSGCSVSGNVGSTCDYYTDLECTQYFASGEEDLAVDVTAAVKAMLLQTIPNAGFRIAFASSEESDQRTYFVKRFASHQAFDQSKHPRLIVGYDDSVHDTSSGMTLDTLQTMIVYSYDHGAPANIVSGSMQITGSNCLKLKLRLTTSLGPYDLTFSGSQCTQGTHYVTGAYSAPVTVSSSDKYIKCALALSGSVTLQPMWQSLDGTVTYTVGQSVTFLPRTMSSTPIPAKKYNVTVNGIQNTYRSDETAIMRVNVFDYASPLIKLIKVPANSPGALQGIASDAFYSIRDAVTREIVVPFDLDHGSTRLSSDATGLFFKFDASNLEVERTYVIDILLLVGGEEQRYNSVSPTFKISDTQ
mgnify:CR=1 FL=1